MRINSLCQVLLMLLILVTTCHAKETKDIHFKLNNAEPVIFSHEIHLLKYNNNCRICHNAIFNLKAKKRFTMAEMEKTKSCGACHTGVKAFSVADDKFCTRCHKGKPRPITYAKLKGVTDAVFSHDVHIAKNGGKCRSCHSSKAFTGKIRGVSMADMEKGRTCGSCHNDKLAFTVAGNCGRCHKGMTPKDITFKIKVGDAQFSHKFHIDLYKCNDCHTKLFAFKAGAKHFSMDEMSSGKSCGACHNGKDAFASSGDCGKCHKGLIKPPTITFKNEGGEAKFSHDFHLGLYKCGDCHTKLFPYQAGMTKASMSQMEDGKFCGACHNGKDAFSVKDECGKCHKM